MTDVISCMMIEAEMYGHDTEGEDRHALDGAAGEHVEHAEQPAGLRVETSEQAAGLMPGIGM